MGDIQSAVLWLGKLLKDEAEYLSAVEDKVHELQDELAWMQCFLRDADGGQLDSVMARRWVSQIREFAYDAEDTVEKFLVNVVTYRERFTVLKWVKKYIQIIWKPVLVHRIGKHIDILKHKMSLLTSKLQTYRINLRVGGRSSSWLFREKPTFTYFPEGKMIGRDKDLEKLVDKCLRSGTERKGIVSIYGVGGVGKTFVANKIFHDRRIRKQFNNFAWAHISEPCQSSAVQQDLLSSLTAKTKEQISQMTGFEMKDELHRVQRKHKCFIVLDGVWSKEVWERLKESFPIESQDFKSMLLVTNRQIKVFEHERETQAMYYHELRPLSLENGMLLLNQIPSGVVKDPPDELVQPQGVEKKDLKEMLEHCEGLPLAICLLRGVLATKRTKDDWVFVRDYLNSFSHEDQHKSRKWKRILELSYFVLPYELKACFLYMGYFLKNLQVPTKKIIRLWVAEGLVSSDDDEVSEYTLEYIAENCLGELVERSLVQVGSRGLAGKAKTCLVHDLISELCKDKASKDNLLSIVPLGAVQKDKKSSKASRSLSSKKSSKPPKNKKVRRLAIYYTTTSANFSSKERQANKNIRSLLFFNTLSSEDLLIPEKLILEEAFNDYKLLRVLDIENISVNKLPKEVGDLIHLRYLNIRGSWVSQLPSTIQNLRSLQTLDLRVLSFVRVMIPDVIFKLERLVHLYLPSNAFDLHKRDEPQGLQLKGLKDLETLSNFCRKCKADDVAELSNLRRFKSCDFIEKADSLKPLLDSSSSRLEHLDRVTLSLNGKILKDDHEVLGNCTRLHKLWVKGEIKGSLTPKMLPEHLIAVSFNNCKFESDPMEILGKLSVLTKLSLESSAVTCNTMKCCDGGFQNLDYLFLRGLDNLEDWTIEGASMPKLCHLKVQSCQKLKMIPANLNSTKSVKLLEISYMPLSFFCKCSDYTNPGKMEESFSNCYHVDDVRIAQVLDISVPVEVEQD